MKSILPAFYFIVWLIKSQKNCIYMWPQGRPYCKQCTLDKLYVNVMRPIIAKITIQDFFTRDPFRQKDNDMKVGASCILHSRTWLLILGCSAWIGNKKGILISIFYEHNELFLKKQTVGLRIALKNYKKLKLSGVLKSYSLDLDLNGQKTWHTPPRTPRLSTLKSQIMTPTFLS